MLFLSRCGHYTVYHRIGDGIRIGGSFYNLHSTSRELYLTSDSHPILRHCRTIRHPLEPFKFPRRHAPTRSRLSSLENPLRSVFVARGGMCDSTHLTELGRNRCPEAGARFPDEPRWWEIQDGFWWVTPALFLRPGQVQSTPLPAPTPWQTAGQTAAAGCC